MKQKDTPKKLYDISNYARVVLCIILAILLYSPIFQRFGLVPALGYLLAVACCAAGAALGLRTARRP